MEPAVERVGGPSPPCGPSAAKSHGFFSRLSLRAGRSKKGAAEPKAFPAACEEDSPPRQSSDTTLQPPSRPSSVPSARCSFDSCADGAPMSDPTHSQRESLDVTGAAAIAAVARSAAPQASQLADPLATAARSQFMQPSAPVSRLGGASGLPPGLPLPASDQNGTSTSSQPQPPFRAVPLGHPGLAREGSHSARRSHSAGGGAANLEHGSTAPPGAMDELAEMLLAATTRRDAASAASEQPAAHNADAQPTAHPISSPERSSMDSRGSVEHHPSNGQAGACGRGPAAPPPASSPTIEPLLSSQVALLAQQLLLQQHQNANSGISPGNSDLEGGFVDGGGTAAPPVHGRHGPHSPHAEPAVRSPPGHQAHQQPGHSPTALSRSKTAPSHRSAAASPLSAAQLLLAGGGRSAGPPGSRSMGHIMGLAAIDAANAAQPRTGAGSAAQPSSEVVEASPFSSVQGTYGCHLLPPSEGSDPAVPQRSPRISTRSSIDLLLDPALPAAARGAVHRPSLDTLSELLSPPPVALSQVQTPGRPPMAPLPPALSGTLSGIPGGTGRLPPPRAAPIVRHSMDETRRLGGASRTLSTLAPARSYRPTRGAAADPCDTSFFRHISQGAMHDLANSTVTVVAGAVPAASGPAARGVTTTAHASAMVDPAAKPATGTFEARIGTPEDSWLDPDLHDTFGAHPSYGLGASVPAAAPLGSPPPHRRTASGGSAALSADGASHGWRLPSAAARRSASSGQQREGHRLSMEWPRSSAEAAAAAPVTPTAAGAQSHATASSSQRASSSAEASPAGNAALVALTAIPGQHSVSFADPKAAVPSLHILKQRLLARQKLERLERQRGGGGPSAAHSSMPAGGGYIAEAKRVLAAAVHTASAQEAAVVESSCSGAIGPLLRYLRDHKHDDAALRSGLHTLSLLVSNSPNRGIIVSFQGQAMLCEAMRATQDQEIRENVVQLLWDLEADDKECAFQPEDIEALQSVLEATRNACTASHILHLMHHCLARADAPPLTPDQMQRAAERLVSEIAAHKHHLQDAAQYALGSLAAVVLGDRRIAAPARLTLVGRLLDELNRSTAPGQCQVVLTVLSCIAGNGRIRSAMAHCQARRRLVEFGQRSADPRLRARSLSLIKILHKQESLENAGGWYFGGMAGMSEASSSPPSR